MSVGARFFSVTTDGGTRLCGERTLAYIQGNEEIKCVNFAGVLHCCVLV